MCSFLLVMVNILSLFIVLKWFFIVCIMWKWLFCLFLKYSILFIMCFSIWGLVNVFFFVMWFIRNKVVFVCLVKCIRVVAYLCIWDILLGVEFNFLLYMVWIEFIIIIWGFFRFVVVRIFLMLVFDIRCSWFMGKFSFCVCKVICCKDFLLVI